jgi:MutL protein
VTRPSPGSPRRHLVTCVDVGSTSTKAAVVEVPTGRLRATAEHPTTTGTDVLEGLTAAVAAAGGGGYPLLVCSSAGGGLRLAVVGYESLVTARAGTTVGLFAGAQVVHVAAGPLDGTGMATLRAARPDVVLLVGGTDGGDAEVLRHNGRRLAAARLRVPVVLAGNAQVRAEVAGVLAGRGVAVVPVGNVLPRIGVLDPGPARAAIRDVFTRHVIGGKRLSRGPRFARLVRAATPDAVLAAVELLAGQVGGDLAVVDVGGATTDVYSARGAPRGTAHDAPGGTAHDAPGGTAHDAPGDAARVRGAAARPAAGTAACLRTVEGDLGVRSGAAGVVRAALAQRLLTGVEPAGVEPARAELAGAGLAAPGAGSVGAGAAGAAGLAAAAARRTAEPGLIAAGASERAYDLRLAGLAVTLGLRRHAAAGASVREARLLIGSGGVLRHAPRARAVQVVRAAAADRAGGWAVPEGAAVVVDGRYVLAAAGLLAPEHPQAARALLRRLVR